jgi:hypothetical protein
MEGSPEHERNKMVVGGRLLCDSMGCDDEAPTTAKNVRDSDGAESDGCGGGGGGHKLHDSPNKRGATDAPATTLPAEGMSRTKSGSRKKRARESPQPSSVTTPKHRTSSGGLEEAPPRPEPNKNSLPTARGTPRRRKEMLRLEENSGESSSSSSRNDEAVTEEEDDDERNVLSDHEQEEADASRACPVMPVRRNRARSLSDAQVENLRSTTAQMLFNSDLSLDSSTAVPSASFSSSSSDSSNEASPIVSADTPSDAASTSMPPNKQELSQWRRKLNEQLEGQSLLRRA